MGSFKLKLVMWFALLALLPLAVAFYGYDSLTRRSETGRTDAALQAGLRGVVAGYSARLTEATTEARRLANDPALQRALRGHDQAALAKVAAAHPTAVFGFGAGGPGAASVVDRHGRVIGSVSVRVPIDPQLVRSLAAGLSPSFGLVAARLGRIVAGVGSGSALPLQPGHPSRVRLGGTEYRGLQTAPLAQPKGLVFAVVERQRAIDAAGRSSEERLFAALLASLLIFGIVTYLLGRSIVGTLRRLVAAANAIADGRLSERVEVRGRDEFAELGTAFNRMAAQLEQRLAELQTERERMRDATIRFGEALMATHDPGQLVRVVVESAVESTGATGGVVLGPHGELARAGDPDAGLERISFPLRTGSSDFGQLVLASNSFEAEQIETATSLANQVVVALENARLHRLVERQALVDSLTGLANRRSVEETLRSELARASRFGTEVCVVFADLDFFKLVNDKHGHAAGDEVLKAFALALRETVRESDVAGRWGGEEFAMVLTGTGSIGGARLAERARVAIEARSVEMPNGELVSVTASFGVASYPETHELGELLAAADSALYEAKRAGRNRVAVSPESSVPKIV
jgi:diguanylate cyclase (GGDEF)-like protein